VQVEELVLEGGECSGDVEQLVSESFEEIPL
jgi:hypothetical protein